MRYRRRESPDPHETAEKVQALGRRFTAIQADLSQQDEIETIVDRAVAAMGRVDILVNNAGTIRRADALSFSEKDWDEVINLNLKSVFFFHRRSPCSLFSRVTAGKSLTLPQCSPFRGFGCPLYRVKSGVLGITRLMANEWAGHRINVNAIAPGYMATNNTQQLREDAERSKAILDRIPAGRWGVPDDLQGPVVFSPPGRRNTLAALRWR